MLGLADGQPMVLTQLDGERQEVVLADADLPAEEFEVPSELRMSSTLYPRSSRKHLQLLGVDEGDIPLEGQFRDVWGAVEGHAAAQAQALRDLYIGQRLVELVWGELLVRRGVVRNLRLRIRSEAVIAYRFDFHVVEADEASIVTRPFEEPVAQPYDLFDLLDDLEDAAETALRIATLTQIIRSLAES